MPKLVYAGTVYELPREKLVEAHAAADAAATAHTRGAGTGCFALELTDEATFRIVLAVSPGVPLEFHYEDATRDELEDEFADSLAADLAREGGLVTIKLAESPTQR